MYSGKGGLQRQLNASRRKYMLRHPRPVVDEACRRAAQSGALPGKVGCGGGEYVGVYVERGRHVPVTSQRKVGGGKAA